MFWRSILSAIDSLFFGLVRDCFKLILYIADVEIFNEGSNYESSTNSSILSGDKSAWPIVLTPT